MTNGDAYQFDPVPVAPERGQQWIVLVVFYLALLVAAEVSLTTPTYIYKPVGQSFSTRTNAHYAEYSYTKPFEEHKHHHRWTTHPHNN